MMPVFKNNGESSTAKNYRPVSLLSVVSKFFEKLVKIMFLDHLEKCSLFSDFQYGFRFSRSNIDLMTVASDKITRACSNSGATQILALDRAVTEFDMLIFFTNVSLMEFWVRYLTLLCLFSVIGSLECFWIGSIYKNIQLTLEFLKAPLMVLQFSYYTLMTFVWNLYCYPC